MWRAHVSGVTLEEYAEAYDAQLEALQTARMADSVQVTIDDGGTTSGQVVYRLVYRDGWTASNGRGRRGRVRCAMWNPDPSGHAE